MVRITRDLVRKKSEHNELMISTLEELSLHQEDIEKIEHIQNWCRNLRILLLQNNLIAKLENLNKLKKLEYLNLAINNIELVENLEKLESLEKLDLTLNFIGVLTSIENLTENYNLNTLILTGNPCTDYPGYRQYVITVLPQLKFLDGTEITKTERLIAKENFDRIRIVILKRQIDYQFTRDEQKIRVSEVMAEQERELEFLGEEEKLQRFWNSKSEHCPEIRIEIAKKNREARKLDKPQEQQPEKPIRKLFSETGRPYCINEPKLEFEFFDEPDRFELNLFVYKFLDTSLIDVDLQVNYIRVSVKGKIFQIGLNDEIKIEESTSKRSTTTGNLLVVMPKLKYDVRLAVPAKLVQKKKSKSMEIVGTVDYKNIVKHSKQNDDVLIIDESDVPPLI